MKTEGDTMGNHFDDRSMDAVISRLTEQIRVMNETLSRNNEYLIEIEKRLQDLERWKSWLLGGAAAVAAVVSALVHILTKRDI